MSSHYTVQWATEQTAETAYVGAFFWKADPIENWNVTFLTIQEIDGMHLTKRGKYQRVKTNLTHFKESQSKEFIYTKVFNSPELYPDDSMDTSPCLHRGFRLLNRLFGTFAIGIFVISWPCSGVAFLRLYCISSKTLFWMTLILSGTTLCHSAANPVNECRRRKNQPHNISS